MRCMRRVFDSIVSRNRSRSPSGSSRSRSVSANPPITVSGVLSSCDTFATKSRRIVSSRRRVVRSMTASTAPPSGSGRAVTSSVRSPSASSLGSVGHAVHRAAHRVAHESFLRQEVDGEGNRRRRATEQSACALVQSHDLAARAHGDDSFVERVDDGVEQRVLRFERGETRRELLGHAVQRDGEIADFARRGERRAPLELAGGDRLRDVAQLDDRPRHASRERECDDQRADEGDQAGERARRAARRSRSRGTSPSRPETRA